MIQNFEVQGGPEFGHINLPKLRETMKGAKLDGFLVPHEDEYQNEYLPDCNERLMWLSGFTGSAGAAVVMSDKAAIFVDGRYTLQVRAQVDESLFSYERLEQGGVTAWLKNNVRTGQVIGYDPKLHSPNALKSLTAAIESANACLTPVDINPIDSAWEDRPAPPKTPLEIHPEKYAGRTHAEKREEIARSLIDLSADAALITSPASIAWLLNIRGGDVMCTPLPLSTVIIDKDAKVQLFVDVEKITDAVRSHLGNHVSIKPESFIDVALEKLKSQTVIVDPSVTSAWYFSALSAAKASIKRAMDPVALPKARKNAAEIAGTTEAHKRDGAALTRYLHWLDTEAQSGEIDEIAAASQLEQFRHDTGVLRDLSFETISGAGSNGAIVHYRVSKATTLKLERGSLFLIDSGGQYQDGTTDVTRTVPIGTPSEEMRERFTLVLKGHIALALVRFPEGTTGSNLDVIARMALWAQGLDYDHGTGHGVGVFLGVHEGPQRISKAPNNIALEPGMIVSNEPGYYKTGAYGIRIENLQYVTEPRAITGGERDMLGFETLTLAPLHKDLIETDMLTEAERTYVDAYHAQVLKEIGPRVEGEVKKWLEKACTPL